MHFMPYLKKYCGYMTLGMICLTGSQVAVFLVPYLVGVVINTFEQKSMETANYWCLVMAGAVVGSSVFTFLRIAFFQEVACRLGWMIKYDLFH